MKLTLRIIICCFFIFGSRAQEKPVQFANTIKINENDSRERIIAKAAHVVPTKNQLTVLEDEFIAFIHFGPNTFTRMEWGNGKEEPTVFDLKELDTDQWCHAMKNAGMKKVILTVKHHDGFVLWQSRYTTHGIMSSDFQSGKGDVLKDLSESCRKYGLKLGIYLSPADLYQIENPGGLYGNLSKHTKRTIPRKVPGRPFANKTQFVFEVDDYNEYFLNQLFELLTEYGIIHEVWFDGAHPKRKGGQKYNYPAWKKLIHKLAPKAAIFGREDIRWCGNEAGATRDTEWNIIPYPENPDTTSNFPDLTDKDLGSREKLYEGKYLHYQPAETNTSIREGWFYRDDTHQKVRSVDDVFDIYERSVGGNSTFLLNIPPNRDGKFSPADIAVLEEVGKRIRKTYNNNLLTNAEGPEQVLDNQSNTFVLLDKTDKSIILSTLLPITFNRLMLQEAVATHSERVEKHAVDVWLDGQWKEIAAATNIGYKRILRFPDVTANRVRVRITESRLNPAISHISAYYYSSHPPQLVFNQDKNGMVSIEPIQQEFNWNQHGENSASNLNAGYEIFYTLDGSEPMRLSKKYERPIPFQQGQLKAVSFIGNEKGAVHGEQLGIAKKDWRLLNCSSEKERKGAALAFDANPHSYWETEEDQSPHFIAIDLGKEYSLKAFAYTPQIQYTEGRMAKGIVQASNDGISWTDVETFEFGNLINDPSKRTHFFTKIVTTRYIRIQTAEIVRNGKSLAIAELDFL